jgi:hypothetical protein
MRRKHHGTEAEAHRQWTWGRRRSRCGDWGGAAVNLRIKNSQEIRGRPSVQREEEGGQICGTMRAAAGERRKTS